MVCNGLITKVVRLLSRRNPKAINIVEIMPYILMRYKEGEFYGICHVFTLTFYVKNGTRKGYGSGSCKK